MVSFYHFLQILAIYLLCIQKIHGLRYFLNVLWENKNSMKYQKERIVYKLR